MGNSNAKREVEKRALVTKNPVAEYERRYYSEALDENYPPFTKREIARLKQFFIAVDRRQTGFVQIENVMQMPQVMQHTLSLRIGAFIKYKHQQERTDKMNFKELTELLAVFHPMSDLQAKFNFLFNLIDLNSNGLIEKNEVLDFIKDIYWKKNSYESLSEDEVRKRSLFLPKDLTQMCEVFMGDKQRISI
jgi:Ca2+-binding EF-hand superfamily protein